jgi:hypothetical protein
MRSVLNGVITGQKRVRRCMDSEGLEVLVQLCPGEENKYPI